MKVNQQQFEDYWRKKGRLLRIKNAERFYQNLSDKIGEFGDTTLLDDYVTNLRKGKEVARRVVTDFYHYLGEHSQAGEPESELYDMHFYDYPFERQFEIAKFLHTEKTISEIQEQFHIDARTARNDLQELEEGITIMGATVQISKEKKGRRYYYRSTLHPVFLPLNLTEVYALTVYLNRIIKDNDPNAEIIRDITDRIKSQLSPYVLQKLFQEERQTSKNEYIYDEELAHRREGIVMYLMKSGSTCRFFWKGNEYTGRIIWSAGKYRIETEDGEILDAGLDEVEFVIDSLDYE